MAALSRPIASEQWREDSRGTLANVEGPLCRPLFVAQKESLVCAHTQGRPHARVRLVPVSSFDILEQCVRKGACSMCLI